MNTNSEMPLVYVLEDDIAVGQAIKSIFSLYRLKCFVFSQERDLIAEVEDRQPNICIIDSRLAENGLNRLSSVINFDEVGIIITSGADTLSDAIKSYQIFADDFLQKPYEPRELVARLQSLLRRLDKQQRTKNQCPETVHFETWSFEPGTLKLCESETGYAETIGRAEAEILIKFLKSPYQILTRDQLLGDNCEPFDRSIDVRISRLRKKLDCNPKTSGLLKTVYGAGYILSCEVDWLTG